MGLGNTLSYGLPPVISLNTVSDNASGASVYTGPYKHHSYQVSGNDSSNAKFKVYATNQPNQEQENYHIIAEYDVTNGSRVTYSDEWMFDSAYAAITNYSAGTFTITEKHSP